HCTRYNPDELLNNTIYHSYPCLKILNIKDFSLEEMFLLLASNDKVNLEKIYEFTTDDNKAYHSFIHITASLKGKLSAWMQDLCDNNQYKNLFENEEENNNNN